jgi:Dna[CI] antecedent, DciA
MMFTAASFPAAVARRTPLATLDNIFAADPQIAQWQRRVARNGAILEVVRRVLPRALGASLAVDAGESGELRLVTASGATAAVLRQRVADLKSALAREGLDFTAIRVVVQPQSSFNSPRKPIHNQWDASASEAFRRLAETLPEGPLKDAAARLGRRR